MGILDNYDREKRRRDYEKGEERARGEDAIDQTIHGFFDCTQSIVPETQEYQDQERGYHDAIRRGEGGSKVSRETSRSSTDSRGSYGDSGGYAESSTKDWLPGVLILGAWLGAAFTVSHFQKKAKEEKRQAQNPQVSYVHYERRTRTLQEILNGDDKILSGQEAEILNQHYIRQSDEHNAKRWKDGTYIIENPPRGLGRILIFRPKKIREIRKKTVNTDYGRLEQFTIDGEYSFFTDIGVDVTHNDWYCRVGENKNGRLFYYSDEVTHIKPELLRQEGALPRPAEEWW
jgi:hypothetical protein